MKKLTLYAFTFSLIAGLFVSCNNDDDSDPEPEDNGYEVPSTYEFTRDGNNTVSFDGQISRMNQLAEMTADMKTGNKGEALDADHLKNMYANENIDEDPFTGTKQLKNKTIGAADGDASTTDLFESYMEGIAAISGTNADASEGTAGILTSDDNSREVLVNEYGIEYTQLIEKGLMGAVFLHQISNVYLGVDKMNVDNESPEDPDNGAYYTSMEHHWDEAFGYFTNATDYPNNDSKRFWGKYANNLNEHLESDVKIMDAFLEGRAAISNGDMEARDAAIATIRAEIELVTAATAIHYYNSGADNFGDLANMTHALSEAIAFTRDIKYAYSPKMSNAEIDEVLMKIDPDYDPSTMNPDEINLYNAEVAKLNEARDLIAAAYGLEDIKDQL